MNDIEFQLIDCTNVNISTPIIGKTYLQYINGAIIKPSQNIQRYEIKYSENCCTETTIKIPVNYQFSINLNTCTSLPSSIPPQHNYNINLLGINSLFISTLRLSYNNINYTNITFNSITNGFNYDLFYDTTNVTLPINTSQTYTHYLEITTLDGFVYRLEISFLLTSPGLCNLSNLQIVNVIRPALDSRIYIYNNLAVLPNLSNTLSLNQLYYSTNNTTPPSTVSFTSGVRQIVICEYYLTNPLTLTSLVSNCIQNSYFFDCDLICNVISKLIECPNTNIMVYYNALTYSNNCNISYKDKCSLYEIFYNKLNTIDCEDPCNDCNKSNITTPQKHNNVRYRSVSPCGCN